MLAAKREAAARSTYREGTHLLGAHVDKSLFRAIKVLAAEKLIPMDGIINQACAFVLTEHGKKAPGPVRQKPKTLGFAVAPKTPRPR